jgi:hypothetical protein
MKRFQEPDPHLIHLIILGRYRTSSGKAIQTPKPMSWRMTKGITPLKISAVVKVPLEIPWR